MLKTRSQGRSVVVTLPAQKGVTILSDTEYLVSYEEDGAILLIPKLENPFIGVEEGAFYEADVWQNMVSVGSEGEDD